MANFFTTRATEQVKLNEAFLGIVTPDPIACFLQPAAGDDGLYRRLIHIQGPPGSGKTTIARLFEFSTLATLMQATNNVSQSPKSGSYSELVGPMSKCGALADGAIRVLGCRLPMESDYRELWQLPYQEGIRNDLLFRLIQARAILAWFNQLGRSGIAPADVSIVPRADSHAPLMYIGGATGAGVLERAKEVESAVYRIVGALLPPEAEQIADQLIAPYAPFDTIESFVLREGIAQLSFTAKTLRPLLILDDAHFLHQPQLASVRTWLIRRQLNLGRWILARLDLLKPQELFESLSDDSTTVTIPGITADRDIVYINLQNTNRKENRKLFRSMADQMSRKYLRQMRIFEQNDIHDLQSILPERIESLAPSFISKLEQSVQTLARRTRINKSRLKEFEVLAEDYLKGRQVHSDELKLAIVRILIHRYTKRTPQTELFNEDTDIEPNKPLKVDLSVFDGACIHLLHEFQRPYYVGFDSLANAASENAETFLQIASKFVETAENLLMKQRSSVIPAKEQHRLLVERSAKIVSDWNFPEHRRVRTISDWIAKQCLERTLEGNAPLGHGANAYGIPLDEFERLVHDHPALAQVLKFGVAYNALILALGYECKNRQWCILELGGVYVVKEGLPFKRGGFIEGTSLALAKLLQD
jgi:hypothetical protein